MMVLTPVGDLRSEWSGARSLGPWCRVWRGFLGRDITPYQRAEERGQRRRRVVLSMKLVGQKPVAGGVKDLASY
jgi:hypothetical protein